MATGGEYFNRGAARQKLDRFLVFFERYQCTKIQMPMDVEFMVSDLFVKLRPKMTRAKGLNEGHNGVMRILQEEHEKQQKKRTSLYAQCAHLADGLPSSRSCASCRGAQQRVGAGG